MTTKAQAKRDAIEAGKQAAYEKKVRTLIGHLVSERISSDAIMAGYHGKTEAETMAAHIAQREPVGAAVHPLKAVAVARARSMAEDTVAKVRADLEAHNWKINECAPYPRGNVWAHDYEAQRAKANLYATLTEDGAYKYGEPKIVQLRAEGVEYFIEKHAKWAALDYDAFICKLVSKVGDVVFAEIEGSHVWGHSILTVHKEGSEQTKIIERWKTHQIVNQSKFGRLFNQWPTRLMK